MSTVEQQLAALNEELGATAKRVRADVLSVLAFGGTANEARLLEIEPEELRRRYLFAVGMLVAVLKGEKP